eukprot:751849-Hanusia_phi.AAC.3
MQAQSYSRMSAGISSGVENMASRGPRSKRLRTGGHVPTTIVAPALASCLAIAHPYPLESATPATKATWTREGSEKQEGDAAEHVVCGSRVNGGTGAKDAPSGDKRTT